jgi:hypothetical protein
MKQDKAMLARHNRLMHPGQKSKLKSGGMVKKYADGGNVTAQKFEKERDEPVKSLKGEEPKNPKVVKHPSMLGPKKELEAIADMERVKAQGSAYGFQGKTVGEIIEEKNKRDRRIRELESQVEDGYKKGGMVKSKAKGDKKKVMGTVGEAKAVMAALQKARRPATPMPGTRMAGLGMAPPMAPQMAPPMKRGGKVMKKAAGGAAKLRRASPTPDKIRKVPYVNGG